MSHSRIRTNISDSGVATVTMTRSDKHNALDRSMFEGLLDAASQLAANRKARAVVLHGEGESFCSGIDISSFLADSKGGVDALFVREDHRLANFVQRAAYDWSTVPVPVIAAISGNCFGGGMQIALGADIRIASPTARFSLMEVKWGLVPDMAITQTLPRVMGIDVAKELTFTGRIVSGLEASALGLVTRTAEDPLTEAHTLADEIAKQSPDAVRAAKRLYDETWTGTHPARALALESELQKGLLGSPNQKAAVAAGVSGKAPSFVDPY